MKRKIAKRELQRKCITCGDSFKKGNVYYLQRTVYEECGEVTAYEYIQCPKCVYKEKEHKRRFEEFKKKCEHPNWAIYTIWDYIPGECVREPAYDKCRLCGEWF